MCWGLCCGAASMHNPVRGAGRYGANVHAEDLLERQCVEGGDSKLRGFVRQDIALYVSVGLDLVESGGESPGSTRL